MRARGIVRSTWSTATSLPKFRVSPRASMAGASPVPGVSASIGESDLNGYAGGQVRRRVALERDLREVGEPAAILLRERVIGRERGLRGHVADRPGQRIGDAVDADLHGCACGKGHAQRLRYVHARIGRAVG